MPPLLSDLNSQPENNNKFPILFRVTARKKDIKWLTIKGGSLNTDYVKVPIFPVFMDNFPDFPPIS